MAHTLKTFTFKPRGGRPSKYQWNLWMDGQVWLLKKGEDFDDIDLARNAARQQAFKKGRRLKTEKTPEGHLVLQFYDK